MASNGIPFSCVMASNEIPFPYVTAGNEIPFPYVMASNVIPIPDFRMEEIHSFDFNKSNKTNKKQTCRFKLH